MEATVLDGARDVRFEDRPAPHMRVPLADGTLVATRDAPDTHMIPSLLALSDVMGSRWYTADAANVKPGATVVVVGDPRRFASICQS